MKTARKISLAVIASAEYPAACRGDEGVGNEAVYKNLKDTLRLAAGGFILFSALLLSVYPILAYDDDSDRAVSQIKPLSPEEQLRMKEVFGSTSVSKEQRCTADYNCCSTRYFDQNGKFIGSSDGCLNSDPDEPFKYDPSMEFFDKDGKPIGGEISP